MDKEVREAAPDGEGKRVQWCNKKTLDFTHFLIHKSTLLSRTDRLPCCSMLLPFARHASGNYRIPPSGNDKRGKLFHQSILFWQQRRGWRGTVSFPNRSLPEGGVQSQPVNMTPAFFYGIKFMSQKHRVIK